MWNIAAVLWPLAVLAAVNPILEPCHPDSKTLLSTLPFCNASLPFADRARDLVHRLSLDEKIGQLMNNAPGIDRLGLPEYHWWNEALHGVMTHCSADGRCATSYPMPLSIAATFDMDLVYQMAQQISTEARRAHEELRIGWQGMIGLNFWAPNINIFRDPRWGRGKETAGEDPYLSGRYAVAYVRGLQEGEDPRYIKAVATLKHFDAYSLENWNGTDRVQFDAIVSDEDLVQTYLPAFRAGIVEGNAKSVMCSLSAVNGVPTCASNWLLQDILRDDWKFDGFVVSDCGAISEVWNGHHFKPTPEEAAAASIIAGTDMDCGNFYSHLSDSVAKKFVTEDYLDLSLGRLFEYRLRLGLFDPAANQPYRQYGAEVVGSQKHRDFARKMAQDGMVLLKNDNSALPLNRDSMKTLALIGPHFNTTETIEGTYHGELGHVVSVFEAFSSVLSADQLLSSEGCDVHCTDTSGFDDAVSKASKADVTVVVLGLDDSVEKEGMDRVDIGFPGQQEELLKAVSKVSKRTILILVTGGSVDLSWAKSSDQVSAIVQAGYPGEEAGNAIMDLVFGAFNPSGRLPVTFYKKEFVDRISFFDMSMKSGPGRTYRYMEDDLVVYPFGHGLSYTTFGYGWSDVYYGQIANTGLTQISYRVTVKNTGSRDGAVSVLAFISFDGASGVTKGSCPKKQLFDFKKVFLKVGESRELLFLASPSDVGCSEGLRKFADPGNYFVQIGDLGHFFTHASQERMYL